MSDELRDDVLNNVKDNVKDELTSINKNYGWVADTFKVDYHTLGSKEWAAGSLNHGFQFKWPGKMPPFNPIAEWVISTKDPAQFGGENASAPSLKLKREVFTIMRHIKKQGLQDEKGEYGKKHYWYFDRSIQNVNPNRVEYDIGGTS
jgi:hypothetical protein